MADRAQIDAIFQDISDAQAKARADKESSYIGTLLQRYKRGSGSLKLLNVGCGLGRHDRMLRRLGHTVYSIDIVPSFVRKAKERNPGFERFYKAGDMTNLKYKASLFDAVLCLFSAFNAPKYPQGKKAMKEFNRVLKRGGLLIMDLQTKGKPDSSYSVAVGDGIIKRVRNRLVGDYLVEDETLLKEGKGGLKKIAHVVDRERMYTSTEIASLCKKNGFDTIVFYRAYTKRKLSARDPQMLVVARKL